MEGRGSLAREWEAWKEKKKRKKGLAVRWRGDCASLKLEFKKMSNQKEMSAGKCNFVKTVLSSNTTRWTDAGSQIGSRHMKAQEDMLELNNKVLQKQSRWNLKLSAIIRQEKKS